MEMALGLRRWPVWMEVEEEDMVEGATEGEVATEEEEGMVVVVEATEVVGVTVEVATEVEVVEATEVEATEVVEATGVEGMEVTGEGTGAGINGSSSAPSEPILYV